MCAYNYMCINIYIYIIIIFIIFYYYFFIFFLFGKTLVIFARFINVQNPLINIIVSNFK